MLGLQIGDESPDIDIGQLKAAFEVTQQLLEGRQISAGHDISDGGIAVALLEMAFAGNTGIEVQLGAPADGSNPMAVLFAEELGLLLEVDASKEAAIMDAYASAGVPVHAVGSTSSSTGCSISVGGQQHITGMPARFATTRLLGCFDSKEAMSMLVDLVQSGWYSASVC